MRCIVPVLLSSGPLRVMVSLVRGGGIVLKVVDVHNISLAMSKRF